MPSNKIQQELCQSYKKKTLKCYKSHICRKNKWKQYDMTDNSKEMKQIFLGEELFNKWC